jgi:hypothetical protein
LQEIKNQELKKLNLQEIQQLEEQYQRRLSQEEAVKEKRSAAFNLYHPEIASFYSELKKLARNLGLAVPNVEIVRYIDMYYINFPRLSLD